MTFSPCQPSLPRNTIIILHREPVEPLLEIGEIVRGVMNIVNQRVNKNQKTNKPGNEADLTYNKKQIFVAKQLELFRIKKFK